MKKVIFLPIFSMLCVSAFAQFGGKQLIGLNTHYYRTGTAVHMYSQTAPLKNSNLSFRLSPYYGVSVNDKFLLGAGIGYSLEQQATQDNPSRTELARSRLYEINIFARRYSFVTDKFGAFAQALAGAGMGKVQGGTGNFNGYETNIKSMQVSLSLGAHYKISNQLGLELHYGNIGLTRLTEYYPYRISPDRTATEKYTVTAMGFDFDKSTFRLGLNYAF